MKNKHSSAGIVPISFADGKPQYLLLRCYTYWDFPKGGLEVNEDNLQAAIRETYEESGISIDNLEFIYSYESYETESYAKNKTATYFIAKVKDTTCIELRPNPETGRPEHHEFRWFSYKDAQKVVNNRILKVLDWANKISTNSNTI